MDNLKDINIPPVPESVRGKLCGDFVTEDIGRSGDWVLMFRDRVLKISPAGRGLAREERAMRFLCGKLRVPDVIAFETDGQNDFLLMSRLEGQMACNTSLSQEKTAVLLAHAIKEISAVDISECFLPDAEEADLAAAKENIQNGKVQDSELFGFPDAQSLYMWLCGHKPAPEVFSHGDFCLPNVFINDGKCGFIDLGGAGVAGKWRDISMCLWSMRYNFCAEDMAVFESAEMKNYEYGFFEELGLAPDEEKINYYLLLGKLF